MGESAAADDALLSPLTLLLLMADILHATVSLGVVKVTCKRKRAQQVNMSGRNASGGGVRPPVQFILEGPCPPQTRLSPHT